MIVGDRKQKYIILWVAGISSFSLNKVITCIVEKGFSRSNWSYKCYHFWLFIEFFWHKMVFTNSAEYGEIGIFFWIADFKSKRQMKVQLEFKFDTLLRYSNFLNCDILFFYRLNLRRHTTPFGYRYNMTRFGIILQERWKTTRFWRHL